MEDSNEAMNERAHGYLPEQPMEVEGMEETTNEGQIILLGKDIEEEDNGEDEESAPGLRGHGDSQSVVFFPPKTPPHHFHHQKVLCDNANIYICIALKIINTPVNQSSSLH